MDSTDFARRVIDRLQNGKPYTLPEMTIDDYIVYVDSLRIPEEMAHISRCIDHLTPEAYRIMGTFTTDNDMRRVHLLEHLTTIQKLFEVGDIEKVDYERLTSEQNYSNGYKQSLRALANRFIPQWEGVGAKGDVYSLGGEYGERVYLRRVNGEWFRDNDPYGAAWK